MKTTNVQHKLIAILLLVINIAFISVFNASSLVALGYTCFLFWLFNRFLTDKKLWAYNFFAFQVLLFIVLGIYIINLSVWPEWLGLGLDGSVGEVGTDSPRFYLGLVSDDKLIPQGLDKDM